MVMEAGISKDRKVGYLSKTISEIHESDQMDLPSLIIHLKNIRSPAEYFPSYKCWLLITHPFIAVMWQQGIDDGSWCPPES